MARIGDILAQCVEQFDLELGATPFQPAFNYVVPAHRSDGEEFILKVGPPDLNCQREIKALQFYAGRGIAGWRLIHSVLYAAESPDADFDDNWLRVISRCAELAS